MDGRFSGNLYGIGWRHEMEHDREVFLRLEYLKMGGTYIDPVRNELQSNVRRCAGSLGWRQHLTEDIEFESSLTYYRQEAADKGPGRGWQTSFRIKREI